MMATAMSNELANVGAEQLARSITRRSRQVQDPELAGKLRAMVRVLPVETAARDLVISPTTLRKILRTETIDKASYLYLLGRLEEISCRFLVGSKTRSVVDTETDD